MKKSSSPRSPQQGTIRKLTMRDLCEVTGGVGGSGDQPIETAALTYDPYRKFKF